MPFHCSITAPATRFVSLMMYSFMPAEELRADVRCQIVKETQSVLHFGLHPLHICHPVTRSEGIPRCAEV